MYKKWHLLLPFTHTPYARSSGCVIDYCLRQQLFVWIIDKRWKYYFVLVWARKVICYSFTYLNRGLCVNFYNWGKKLGIMRTFKKYTGSSIKLGMGWYRFSIFDQRCIIVVGRFSVPLVLGKTTGTKNGGWKISADAFPVWKTQNYRDRVCGKWQSCRQAYIVVILLSAAIHIV